MEKNPAIKALKLRADLLFLEHEELKRMDDIIDSIESSPSKQLTQEAHKNFYQGQRAFLDIAQLLPKLPKDVAQQTASLLSDCYSENQQFAERNKLADHKGFTTGDHLKKIQSYC